MASWTEAKKPNQAATIVTEPDTIFVGGVHQLLHISAAQHSWFNSQKQHVIISAEIERSTKEAGIKDEVDLTVDYSFIYEALLHLNHEAYYSPLSAAKEIAIKIQDVLKPKGLHAVEVTMAVPKYLALTGGELVVKAKLDANPHPDKKDERSWSTEFQFNGLTTQCIVGVGHMERKIKQPLVISITIKGVLNLFEGDDARKIDEDLELDIVQRMMEVSHSSSFGAS
jgi:dihydroneopterin aldolase